jgi:hypothetical protein
LRRSFIDPLSRGSVRGGRSSELSSHRQDDGAANGDLSSSVAFAGVQKDNGRSTQLTTLFDAQAELRRRNEAVLQQVRTQERRPVAGGGILAYAVGLEEEPGGEIMRASCVS